MMVRWLLAAMVGTIALVALLGPPAAIASSAQISVTPVQPIPGERVTVRGSGFCPAPCSAVTVKVDGSVAAGGVAVAPDGTFKVAVGLTPVAGNSTIVASQTDGSGAVRDATAIVHVVPNDQTGPTPTPPPAGTDGRSGETGTPWWMIVLSILIAVAAGAALMWLRGRRLRAG